MVAALLYNNLMDKHLATILEPFMSESRVKKVTKGQIVLYEGDQPNEVYVIKAGVIKIHDISDQGEEKILHLIKAGAVFPLVFFSGKNNPTNWFYTALTDCEFYVAPQSVLQNIIKNNALACLTLMNWFSKEVHELLVRLSSLGKTNARHKLIAALKFLAVCHHKSIKGPWRQVAFAVNHQLLADMTGITRESTAVCMKQFQKEGLIRYPHFACLSINYPKIIDQP